MKVAKLAAVSARMSGDIESLGQLQWKLGVVFCVDKRLKMKQFQLQIGV